MSMTRQHGVCPASGASDRAGGTEGGTMTAEGCKVSRKRQHWVTEGSPSRTGHGHATHCAISEENDPRA